MRIGFGYDSHRFTDEPKALRLGGVEFEGERGLKAHSDGDVVIHAIIDALLGAAALGDVGSHFPDTDEKWKGADSAFLLSSVAAEIAAAGYRLGNLDVTVICERPKIRPRVEEMKARLAELLKAVLPPSSDLQPSTFNLQPSTSHLSVKGKTNEKLDDVGAGLGIEVHAVCLLERR